MDLNSNSNSTASEQQSLFSLNSMPGQNIIELHSLRLCKSHVINGLLLDTVFTREANDEEQNQCNHENNAKDRCLHLEILPPHLGT